MDNFNSVLQWLTSGAGAVILTGWLASWLLEDWKTWALLNAKLKKIIILLISAVLGVGGTLLYSNPQWTAQIQPYLDTLVLVVTAWLTTQVAHKADK